MLLLSSDHDLLFFTQNAREIPDLRTCASKCNSLDLPLDGFVFSVS